MYTAGGSPRKYANNVRMWTWLLFCFAVRQGKQTNQSKEMQNKNIARHNNVWSTSRTYTRQADRKNKPHQARKQTDKHTLTYTKEDGVQVNAHCQIHTNKPAKLNAEHIPGRRIGRTNLTRHERRQIIYLFIYLWKETCIYQTCPQRTVFVKETIATQPLGHATGYRLRGETLREGRGYINV